MARMMNLNDAARQNNLDLSTSSSGTFYDPSGKPAYGSDGSKVGKVDSAILDSSSGVLRYLVVDTGGWFSSKQVLVPVGMARIEDDGVYFDRLTKQQVGEMRTYQVGDDVSEDDEVHNVGVLTGTSAPLAVGSETGSRMNYQDTTTAALFAAPQRLQLLEERLNITKTREKVGEVEVGKRVETHTEKVNVALEREEVVIERHAVSGGQAVTGAVLGGSETITVQLEAERANVSKQAFVVEEVEIGKRVQTETQVVTETVGKEVLEVERNGQMVTDASGKTTTTTTTGKGESLLDQAGNAVKNVVDNVTGNNKR